MKMLSNAILSLLLLATPGFGFTTSVMKQNMVPSTSYLSMSTASVSEADSKTTKSDILRRDRYVATNRFAVRAGKAAKFEKRWATRKSRLATLQGFKYFHLMRRVTMDDEKKECVYDEGEGKEGLQGNYVSFTVWEKKSDFSAWRTGEAFKEAHGGTSITAFVSTMVNSAMVLRGAPRPAFYDGLLTQSLAVDSEDLPTVVDGWRSVEADGVQTLPQECFVACNQFFVPNENAVAFEQRWAQRESKLKECDGFVGFTMLRRDGKAKGHGTSPVGEDEPSYVSTTIWKDRAAFDNWRSGNAFQQAHGQKKDSGKDATPPKPLWSKPPVPIFYEGTLVITKEDGV